MSRAAKTFFWIVGLVVAIYLLLRWAVGRLRSEANPDKVLGPAVPPGASIELTPTWSLGLTPSSSGPSTHFSWYELNKAMVQGKVAGVPMEATSWNTPPPWYGPDKERTSALLRLIARLYLVRMILKHSLMVILIEEFKEGYMLARCEVSKSYPGDATTVVADWSNFVAGASDGDQPAHPWPAAVIGGPGRLVYVGPDYVLEPV